MTEAEMIRLIRQVIRRELAQTLMGEITGTDNSYTTSVQRFATDGEIDGLRRILPYGLASRPLDGTPCVVQPINGDPTHLIVSGEFDVGNRPTVNDGEVALYGPEGQVVYMKQGGKVLIGSMLSDEPLVLGDVLKTFCDSLISALTTGLNDIIAGPVAVSTTPGNPTAPSPVLVTALTAVIAQLNTLKTQYVDTPATNFLSLTNFTE